MQKKKIAVIVASNIYNRKGLFNAAHERIKRLMLYEDYDITPFVISKYYPWHVRLLTRSKSVERPNKYIVDGIEYNIIWLKNTLLDFVLMHKLNRPPIVAYSDFRHYVNQFGKYDLIISHSCAEYAHIINTETGVPYIATWHGSDIHTLGFLSPSYTAETKSSIEGAVHNFFVSNDLLCKSDKICNEASKSVSYNGKDFSFVQFDSAKRNQLKSELCPDKDVVIFVGNIIEVKNVKALPGIFRHIHEKHPNVEFWIVGKGNLQAELESNTRDLPMKFWGNVEHSRIPDLLNVASVLVLPSLNEGLPLTTVEALGCGCNVVGSRVGGIAEAIGIENTFPLELPDFEESLAERCIYFLEKHISPSLPKVFDWDVCVSNEVSVINKIIKQ